MYSCIDKYLEEVKGVFSENEVQSLKDIFELFDKEKQGRIEMKDLDAIISSLERDPVEAKEILK